MAEAMTENNKAGLFTARIYKQSIIIILAAVLICAVLAGWHIAAGVLAGGVIGIANLRGIEKGVKSFLTAEKARPKMIILSMFRLFIVFSVLIALVLLKVVNVLALLGGFTAVILIILKEGLLTAGREGGL